MSVQRTWLSISHQWVLIWMTYYVGFISVNSDGIREELQEIDMDKRMQLYYVDINSISDLKIIPYVSQSGDYTGPDALLGGSLRSDMLFSWVFS